MKRSDYDYLLEQWKWLVDQLLKVNRALDDLVVSQQQEIDRLQQDSKRLPEEEK